MSASKYFDQIAIALSSVCIVHCLAVPIIVAVLPFVAISIGSDSHFHGWMLGLVVPTSLVGFALGLRIHQRVDIVALGAVGVAGLAAAAYWGHSQWGEFTEVVVSVIASLMLGVAHWRNFREVRRLHRHGQ